MAWWQRQFGSSTRGRIVALLRRGPRSVDELAVDLGVTDNAVRAQLSSLARDGVVTDVGARREGMVGKPATLFAIATPADTAFSDAYAPTLATLLQVLGERLTHRELETMMREVGRRLGGATPTQGGALEARVLAGVKALGELGAVADVESHGANFTVRGHGCPLGRAVESRPEACRAVEQLLAQITGAKVTERCVRDEGAPRCTFEITERATR
jgi:predicted ArsR family transcriptional regulator